MGAASAVGGALDAVELSVVAAGGEEGFVGAGLDDAVAVEDDDEVGHAHGAEAVRDEDGDAAGGGGLARGSRGAAGGGGVALEEGVRGLGVERGGGLVEPQEQRALAHEAAGESELLPL